MKWLRWILPLGRIGKRPGTVIPGPFVVAACQVRSAGADDADWYGAGAETRRVYAAGSEATEVIEGVPSCGCH